MPRLVYVGHAPPSVPSAFWFPPAGATIGSDPRNTIVLGHPSVALRHASIVPTATGYWLADAGGPHGSCLRGERTAGGLIGHGDRVDFGALSFMFLLDDGVPAISPGQRSHRSGAVWIVAVLGALALLGVVGVAGAVAAYWLYWRGEQPYAAAGGAETRTTGATTRTIDPGGLEQSVTAQGVRLTVPAGGATQTTKVTIARATNLPPFGGKSITAGDAFLVETSPETSFQTPATLELTPDPNAVAAAGNQPPLVAYFDAQQKTWQFVPSSFDRSRGVVSLRTTHCSLWRLYYLARGYAFRETTHFDIVSDPHHTPILGKHQVESGEFVQRLASYLEEAYRKYDAAGFKLPSGKIWVFVDASVLESQRGTLTGHLSFATTYDNVDQLRYEAAHELFHSVQNQYFNMYSMAARRFWIEATASYAGDQVAWGGIGHLTDGLRPTYLLQPISTTDDRHEYATASFIAYLVRKGVGFRGQWDAVVGRSSAGSTAGAIASGSLATVVTGPLESYVSQSTQVQMPSHFLGFSAYLLLDERSPLMRDDPRTLATSRATLPADKASTTGTLSVAPGYTAKMWAVTVQSKDDKPRRLAVSAITDPPGQARIGVYWLAHNRRSSPPPCRGHLVARNQKIGVLARTDDVIYVIVANTGAEERAVSLRVADEAVSLVITPGSVDDGQPDRSYAFSAEATGLPDSVQGLRYEWDFGDRTQKATGRPPKSGNSTTFSQSHVYAQAGRFVQQLRLFDAAQSGQPALAEANADVEILPRDAGTPPSPSPPPSAAPPSGPGYFELVDVKVHHAPEQDRDSDPGYQVSHGNGFFRLRRPQVKCSLDFRWTPLPPRIDGATPVATTDASVTSAQEAGSIIRCAGKMLLHDTSNHDAFVVESNRTGSKRLSYAIYKGSIQPGDTRLLWVTSQMNESSPAASYQYTYRWVGPAVR
jgi:hypothetical protein